MKTSEILKTVNDTFAVFGTYQHIDFVDGLITMGRGRVARFNPYEGGVWGALGIEVTLEVDRRNVRLTVDINRQRNIPLDGLSVLADALCELEAQLDGLKGLEAPEDLKAVCKRWEAVEAPLLGANGQRECSVKTWCERLDQFISVI